MDLNIYNNMKKISLLFIVSLFISGVFGLERVSVNEGGSVTLHTHLTSELQRDDVILWRFHGDRIVRIISSDPFFDSDKRFNDRLKMNNQTGDLTITHITSEYTGEYKLTIISNKIIRKSFFVSVFGLERVSVNDGGSVTLHTHLTSELQTDDVIDWRFNGDRIARINKTVNSDPVYEPDKRFTDRLKMNNQTGDLTITHITSEHTGEYQLEIINRKTIIKLFSVSVFGLERVSVNDGGSVTLHTHLTSELQTDDVIMWIFNGDRIARIKKKINNSDPVYEPDKRFTDRLKMNNQTGDLTITHITSEHTGEYQLEIINNKTIIKLFSVSLSPQVKIVKERDSVSLHIDVTDEQRYYKIHWKIRRNKSLVAEVITEKGKISTPFIIERFRDRLMLDDQTGDLNITEMKNEDSGQYEADVTIGSNTYTIHKTFSFTRSGDGSSSGVIAVICVSLLVAVGLVACVIHRHPIMRRQESNTGEVEMETTQPLRIGDARIHDVVDTNITNTSTSNTSTS